MTSIPNWFPNRPPIYDISKSCAENVAEGPFFKEEIPKRPSSKHSHTKFLGFDLLSGIGVPAGPLFNSRWIALASRLGFDLLTYKTIRSFAHPGHQLPNMIYVKPLSQEIAESMHHPPSSLEHLTVTNSFGMPSRSPDFLLEDIDLAQRSLQKGQLLIVSIVGTPHQGISFRDDFVRVAQIARAAGAKVIEANFSCPNVGKSEGMLYTQPDVVYDFSRALVSAIHPIPLVLKVGLYPNAELMKAGMIAAARAGVQALCGINSVSMRVIDADGVPALGPSRPTSGICGAAIRESALHFLRSAHEINKKEKLDLTLMGCGGIMLPEHFDEFFEAGVKTALSATGMMWDPLLALRYHWNKAHAHTHSSTL